MVGSAWERAEVGKGEAVAFEQGPKGRIRGLLRQGRAFLIGNTARAKALRWGMSWPLGDPSGTPLLQWREPHSPGRPGPSYWAVGNKKPSKGAESQGVIRSVWAEITGRARPDAWKGEWFCTHQEEGDDEGLGWAVTMSSEDWRLARDVLGGETTRAE